LLLYKEKGVLIVSLSVLIVVDHRSYARSLALALTGFGYRAEVACDSEQASNQVTKQQFDVLIIDYDMLEIKGDNLALKLDKIQSINLKILISGHQLKDSSDKYSFDLTMSKPLDLTILEQQLNKWQINHQ